MPETREFLLEIGCEEIPASWLSSLSGQLAARFTEAAAREHLDPQGVVALGAPRRLCLTAGVAVRQADREEPVWGPAVRAARNAAGAWTPAALGFAKKNGVEPDALAQGTKEGGKEEQLLFVKKVPGRDAREVLPAILAPVLRGLAFPKRMSWDAWLDDGKGAFPFGRPIRWLVALLGGEVVPFTIFELTAGAKGRVLVEAGNRTYGHRFLPRGAAGGPLAVKSFDELKRVLAENYVLLDPKDREKRIHDGLSAVGAGDSRHPLVEEWVDLVEYPTVVLGRVPEEFGSLPAAVLDTVLVHHQKYIPLPGPRFAAVTNVDEQAAQASVRGMERVVVARLRDGAFFYREDMARPLRERVDDLAGVTFHQGLGTYRDKSDRLVRLVGAIVGDGDPGLATRVKDAARLAKADLTTLMVREFTELQGVVGGIYLRGQGEAPEVAAAVQWHYHPVSVEEGSEPAGVLSDAERSVFAPVALADKLDTVAGYFGLGLVPTGSSDPYGLRRAGQGAVRILLDFWGSGARPSLRQLFREAVAGYGDLLKRAAEDVQKDGEAFLLDRLRYVLVSRGFPADEVEAVLGAREPDALDDAQEALARLRALHAVRREANEDFAALAVAFKRARNILEKGQAGGVDPGLFEQDAERELHRAAQGRAEQEGGYESRLRALAGLRAPVDRFFDDVLVMAEDPRVRANRLGLLSDVLSLFYRIADISRLGG